MPARLKPNTRAAWLAAASGQMLRHSPGATKNKIGSSGTMILKKVNSAPAGQTNIAMQSDVGKHADGPEARQTWSGTRLGNSM